MYFYIFNRNIYYNQKNIINNDFYFIDKIF